MFELTVKNRAEKILLKDIPALRKAMTVGALFIIVGVMLSVTVHPYFLVLPLVVSGGLLLSGVGGFCPMAAVMEKLFDSK
jgi:hypothetical protein